MIAIEFDLLWFHVYAFLLPFSGHYQDVQNDINATNFGSYEWNVTNTHTERWIQKNRQLNKTFNKAKLYGCKCMWNEWLLLQEGATTLYGNEHWPKNSVRHSFVEVCLQNQNELHIISFIVTKANF